MKGGYQIIDLSKATAGDPVNIKGAYEAASKTNDKPVMIITADGQRVFAQMKKDGSDYKTTYITGDGYTISVKIESDDDVTLTSTNEGGSIELIEQAIADVNERLDADLFSNTYTQIQSYNSDDNLYEFPTDGYVCIDFGVNVTGEKTLGFLTKNNSITNIYTNSAESGRDLVFVKKGMKVKVTVPSGCVVYFMSLVN